MKIDFTSLGGPVFTGRGRGEDARKRLGFLDGVDERDHVDVIIPDSVYTVTSSYFLGLFGPTIQKLGLDTFHKVFHFDTPSFLKERVEDWTIRAARDRRSLFS